MVIEDLQRHPSLIPTIARWHFDQWGPLTGAATLEGYIGLLGGAAAAPGVPSVLVALVDGGPVGSVSLVALDMRIRPLLTPWLARSSSCPARAGVASAPPWSRPRWPAGVRSDTVVYICTRPEVCRATTSAWAGWSANASSTRAGSGH